MLTSLSYSDSEIVSENETVKPRVRKSFKESQVMDKPNFRKCGRQSILIRMFITLEDTRRTSENKCFQGQNGTSKNEH